MAHYKRDGHRGRGKRNTMDNQACRFAGNSISKQGYHSWSGKGCNAHVSATQRNQIDPEELLDIDQGLDIEQEV